MPASSSAWRAQLRIVVAVATWRRPSPLGSPPGHLLGIRRAWEAIGGDVSDVLGTYRHDDQSLGRTANRYVSLLIVTTIVGLVLFLVFFLFVFLPTYNRMDSGFSGFPAPFSVTLEPPGSGR